MSIGPDGYRLVNAGDFNVDIATADLVDGVNTVVISALDNLGNNSETTVTVNYTSNTIWPTPYAIDWSTLSSDGDITTPDPEIQNVVQIVDGKWTLTNSGVRLDDAFNLASVFYITREYATGDMTIFF